MRRRDLLKTALAAGLVPLAVPQDRFRDDPHRPIYHFLPAANWMNDPNGLIWWKGRYHLFYQYNPNGAFWGTMHWGHASSTDLIHWKHEPVAFAPTPGGPDKDGVFSGCCVVKDGVPTFVYTGTLPETQCIATTRDFVKFEKFAGNPVIASPAAKVTGFRDPCVWQEGPDWMMALGSGFESIGAAVLLYTSKNLIHWNYLHPLLQGNLADDRKMWECPNFFPLGGKHVLLVSRDGQNLVTWMTGEYRDRHFHPEKHGILDPGSYYYAPQAMADANGRRVVFGWSREGRSDAAQKASGWAGVQAIPRVFTLRADGGLGYAPVEAVEKLRGTPRKFGNFNVGPGATKEIAGLTGDCFDLMAEVETDAPRFGLRLRATPDGQERTILSIDTRAKTIGFDRTASSLSPETHRDVKSGPFEVGPGKPVRLRILADRSILEAFMNDNTTITTRVYPTRRDAQGIELFAEGGTMRVMSLTVWPMSSAW